MTQPTYISASSIERIMSCGRRDDFERVQGWATPDANWDLDFGRRYHAGVAVVDQFIAKAGASPASWHQAGRLGLTVALDNVAASPLYQSTDKAKRPYTLARAIAWYAAAREEGKLPLEIGEAPAGNGPGLEVAWAVPLPEWPEVMAVGVADALPVRVGNANYILERKTSGSAPGESYYRKMALGPQVTLSTLAARTLWPELDIAGVLVEVCQTGVGYARWHRSVIDLDPDAVTEQAGWLSWWLRRHTEWVETLGVAPPNFASCMLCPFKPICTAPPRMRQALLKSAYVQTPQVPRDIVALARFKPGFSTLGAP